MEIFTAVRSAVHCPSHVMWGIVGLGRNAVTGLAIRSSPGHMVAAISNFADFSLLKPLRALVMDTRVFDWCRIRLAMTWPKAPLINYPSLSQHVISGHLMAWQALALFTAALGRDKLSSQYEESVHLYSVYVLRPS
jgi:hypothetical protein